MKRFGRAATTAVLALTLILVVPALSTAGPRSAPSTPSTSLAALQGQGWLSKLACGACLTALEVTLVTSTTEPILDFVADNPDLWGECAGVCEAATS